MHIPDGQNPTPLSVSEARLFTEKATATASAIGGPLAGAYLIARNFRTLGKEDSARLTLTVGVIVTLCLFTAITFLPENTLDKIPKHFIPLAYGIVGYIVVRSFQQKDIDAHLAAGGKKGSWHVIVGSGLVSLAISLGYFWIIVTLTTPDEPAPPFAGTPLVFESTGSIIYYETPSIQESDAKVVGRILEDMGYFSKETQLPAGFHMEGSKYTIEMLVDEENWSHPVIEHDVSQFLRILKQSHDQRDYQVVFVMFDSTGHRRSKLFNYKD